MSVVLVLSLLAATVAAYFLGAVPTSYLTGRLLRGIDLRAHGSGNLGATNVFRTLGVAPAVFVLALDIFKGFSAAHWLPLIAPLLCASHRVALGMTLGFAAIAGHVYSPFVGFRGGKGVAAAAGVFLALAPKALAVCVVVWALLMLLTRIVSVASIAAALALPVAIVLTTEAGTGESWLLRGFGILICLAVIITHRSNIGRLVRGEEKRLSRGGQGREKQ
ncbi:glycerol-3-phosphate 1-O-acyltransferase PlsY [bacterium]|nr:glycerol-3-phosphate 1-O-acyltransferase PlsY [bacterium]